MPTEFKLPRRLSRNFYTHEFVNVSSGRITNAHWENLLVSYIPVLQRLRDYYSSKYLQEARILITCFIRSKERNRETGGAKGSAHIHGKVGAVDGMILLPEGEVLDFKELFATLKNLDKKLRIGVYKDIEARPHFHIDDGLRLETHPFWQELVTS